MAAATTRFSGRAFSVQELLLIRELKAHDAKRRLRES